MRIAYVINSVEGGGAALPVPSIAEVLRRTGAEVRLFALTCRDGRALPAMANVGLETIVRGGGEKDHGAALAWLDRQIAEWQPSHLWTSLTRATLLGQIAGLRRRIPVVSWQHAAYLKPANRRLLRTTQRLSRLWIGDSDRVTQLSAERLGIGQERLVTWPIFRADPAAPLARVWSPGETVRIGTLGRLHPVKGYDVLIDALARLKDHPVSHELIIGGDGGERAALETAVRAAGLSNVRFAGYVGDPRGFLADIHLYAQPSRSEGFCVAAHEAMQAGLPVVASAVGEMPNSIAEGQTGWTAFPGDADALTKALRTALSRPERFAPMGMAGRTRVLDRFGPENFEAIGRSIVERMASF
ncbi:glycosyltransferase [Sphingomonas montanisoli]|uniref:Glycosyltransferase n=1 Tax=Sphingomonas montanisoli TaxID=2606412 RepID=A0A5D9CDZ3_9SPHN|nr:glycosyltransferase [Sphingomonas montanisoli]TZG29557.1 glycosyltransferase [Sphingomonas montanisoli]